MSFRTTASRFWTQGESDSEELTGSDDEVETRSRPGESSPAAAGSRYLQGNASDRLIVMTLMASGVLFALLEKKRFEEMSATVDPSWKALTR
ncbi:hypothetical protein ACLOJK_000328 [Asimina triloba]